MKASEMLGKRLTIDGNAAFALSVYAGRTEVSALYCITPSSSAAEKIVNFLRERPQAQTLWMESEHSAMEANIAASWTGCRAATVTSGHGLLLMHEPLHSASRERRPIVLGVANRAIGLPWNIWPDLQDSLSQRDTGWLQIYCESVQEIFDTTLQAFKIAEQLMLPIMVCYEGFILSHLAEQVITPTQKEIDDFLPLFNPDPEFVVRPDNPRTFGGSCRSPIFVRDIQKTMERARKVCKEVMSDFEKSFGRKYDIVEPYGLNQGEKKDLILVAAGITASLAKEVVDRNKNIGLLRLRVFRPFPYSILKNWLQLGKKIAVIDRAVSFGSKGIFAQEIESAMYSSKIPIFNYIRGISGQDIQPEDLEEDVADALNSDNPDILRWRDKDDKN